MNYAHSWSTVGGVTGREGGGRFIYEKWVKLSIKYAIDIEYLILTNSIINFKTFFQPMMPEEKASYGGPCQAQSQQNLMLRSFSGNQYDPYCSCPYMTQA